MASLLGRTLTSRRKYPSPKMKHQQRSRKPGWTVNLTTDLCKDKGEHTLQSKQPVTSWWRHRVWRSVHSYFFFHLSTTQDKFFYRKGVCKTKWQKVELERYSPCSMRLSCLIAEGISHSLWLSVLVKEQVHCLKSILPSGIGELSQLGIFVTKYNLASLPSYCLMPAEFYKSGMDWVGNGRLLKHKPKITVAKKNKSKSIFSHVKGQAGRVAQRHRF